MTNGICAKNAGRNRVLLEARSWSLRRRCSSGRHAGRWCSTRGVVAARPLLALPIQGGEGAVKRYCISCDGERHLREERRSQSFVVRGEVVEFEAPVLVCAECGEVVFDPEYDGEVLRTAHDVYRKKHGLLTSGEIAAVRRRHGM